MFQFPLYNMYLDFRYMYNFQRQTKRADSELKQPAIWMAYMYMQLSTITGTDVMPTDCSLCRRLIADYNKSFETDRDEFSQTAGSG